MKYYNYTANLEQWQYVSENHHEETKHGTPLFPCAAYLDLYCGDSCLWHWHDEMEVGYVQEGSLTVSVNDFSCTLQEGEGIFINAGILHSYTEENKQKAAFPNILFLPSLVYGSQESVFWSEYLRPLSNSALSCVVLKRNVPWQANILDKIMQIMEAFKKAAIGYQFHVRSYLSEIILDLYRNNQVLIKKQVHNNIELDRIYKMLAFIEDHYMEQIQIHQIAESAFISPRECFRIFKNRIGSSPKKYVSQLRIKKAKIMLSETTLPISEICDCCGIQSQSYLTKMFREQFGVTPAKFRKCISHNHEAG